MAFDTPEQKSILQKSLDQVLPTTTDETNPNFAPGVVFGVTNSKETVYLEASGVANLETKEPISIDSIFSIFSCTKAITALAVLQLVEKGLVDLDAPASNYLPKLEKLKVYKGKDDKGESIWEEAKTAITTRMLLTHTAGFSYSFFHEEYARIRKENGDLCIFDIRDNLFDEAFLVNQPGEKWHYGLNLDFVGKIVEAVSKQSLGEYMKKNIFEPAELDSFTFHLKPDQKLVTIHYREGDKVVLNSFQAIKDPLHDLGGSGVFGQVNDYLKFIRIWLNKGVADNGNRLLKEETVKLALLAQWTEGVGILESFEPEILNSLPDKGVVTDWWSLPFSINAIDFPTGRPKGSFHWAGIANLYYWIDKENGIGGFYASQILPFMERSVENLVKLESTVYANLK